MTAQAWINIVVGGIALAALIVSILGYRRQGAAVRAAELSAASAKRMADRSDVGWELREWSPGSTVRRIVSTGRDPAYDVAVTVEGEEIIRLRRIGPGSSIPCEIRRAKAFATGHRTKVVVTWIPHPDWQGEREPWNWDW